jgi:hypothetical protein
MKLIAGLMIAGVIAGVSAPAFAGSTAPAPSATPLGDTISLEFSPEWKASGGAYADSYAKVGFSHSLGNGWGMGVSIQDTVKPNNGGSSWQPEATLGYKWKMDAITFGLTGGLGYNSGTVGGAGSDKNDVVDTYYFGSATIDWKLDSKWTWNVINARYRDGFEHKWFTPKVATGFSYQIDPRQAVYTAVGYAWKDTGDGNGLLGDKINLALGYKLGF